MNWVCTSCGDIVREVPYEESVLKEGFALGKCQQKGCPSRRKKDKKTIFRREP